MCIGLPNAVFSNLSADVEVDASRVVSTLDHFWRSTGMCPPQPHQNASSYFLSKDMYLNLLYVGSVPHSGIKQVRMHWLLDLVTYDRSSNKFNFTSLDILFKTLNKLNLNPGFELMGSPSKYFKDFDDDKQVMEWMEFVENLAKRYIGMFGLKNVAEWNFETWNEPDHKDFDEVKMSVNGFLKYYDASSEGLRAADQSLVFGGPGASCRKKSFSKRCWALFDHCVNGFNYITGKKGSRLDYISFHKKGGGSSASILEDELSTVREIHTLHPSLTSAPIYNDEGDPMVGWSKPYSWRADSTYPAIVSKIISQHQHNIIANHSTAINYALLSNDNGFLNYYPHFFSQRTLTARFQMNNTTPKHVHLVKKPIYSLMVLLSKLGEMQLSSSVRSSANDGIVGVIASVCNEDCPSREVSILLYASNDTSPTTAAFDISLHLQNLSLSPEKGWSSDVKLVRCTINNKFVNPSMIWENAGKPDFPSAELFRTMHDVSEPYCTNPTEFSPGYNDASVALELDMPGVMLLHICWRPADSPSAPRLISVTNVTSAQVMVTWSDTDIKTKCILSYIIHRCDTSQCKSYSLVNERKIISNSFVYIDVSGVDEKVHGFYRVAVQDFWGRLSHFSNIIPYGNYSD